MQFPRRAVLAALTMLALSASAMAETISGGVAALDGLLGRYVVMGADGVSRVDYGRWKATGPDVDRQLFQNSIHQHFRKASINHVLPHLVRTRRKKIRTRPAELVYLCDNRPAGVIVESEAVFHGARKFDRVSRVERWTMRDRNDRDMESLLLG